MQKIKIQIKKRKIIGNPPNPWVKFDRVENVIIIPEKTRLNTEAKFCNYIYRKYGEGRYQAIAWQKGYRGFWLFWLGDLYHNGFVRDVSHNKDIQKLKVSYRRADSYEEKEMIEEEIESEKEMDDRKTKRRGPRGIIKLRPGIMHSYEEVEIN